MEIAGIAGIRRIRRSNPHNLLNPHSPLSLLAAAAGILLACSPARGVIKVEFPVTEMFATSESVWTGKVESVRAENKVVTVKITSAAKGEAPADSVMIQVLQPAGLAERLKAGSDVVLFVGKAKGEPLGILHIGDEWLMAKSLPGPRQAWRVFEKHPDAAKKFPGASAALVRYLAEIKAGKPSLLNHVDPEVFRRPPRLVGKLAVTAPTFLDAADLDGDGTPELLVGSPDGVKLFAIAADGCKDVTAAWAVPAGKGGYHAFGDLNGDGKPDLLLDDRLLTNQGGKFSPSRKLELPKARPLAAAIINAGGKAALYLLDANGELRIVLPSAAAGAAGIRLWKDADTAAEPAIAASFGNFGDTPAPCALVLRENGVTRYALDGNAPPADFQRLTGVNLQEYYDRYKGGLKHARAAALDINADGRGDLFVLCDSGGLLLVNRGFGCFLVDYDAGGVLAPKRQPKLPFTLSPATPWAAADMNKDGFPDLLILTGDSSLYEIRNVPPPGSRPAGH